MMLIRRITLFAFLFASCTAAGDGPRGIVDYAHEFGPGMNKNVPRQPLSTDHVERWARILNASPPQLHFIDLMYERFVERHNEFMDREAPRYCALSAELAELGRMHGLSAPAYVELMVRMDQANRRFRQGLISIEHSFIDSIESVLTPDQLERSAIVRNEATRRNCRTFRTAARWVQLELRFAWDETAAERASGGERTRVEDLLAHYEAQLTTLMCRRADLEFETRQRLADNRIAMNAGIASGTEGIARYEQIMGRLLDASRRIRELQVQTFNRVVETVRPETASAFVRSVKRTVFPELYPDPTALHDLFDLLANHGVLNEDASLAVESLFESYLAQYKIMCERMESICIEWGDQSEAGVSGFELHRLSEALNPLLSKRTELSRVWLAMLEQALDSGVLELHAAMIPEGLRCVDVGEGSSSSEPGP